MFRSPRLPRPQGLYDPANEHDACGVAFVADARGARTHGIVPDGLTALHNLDHRGAAGAEPTTGDGAGILTQVPDALLRDDVDFDLPEPALARRRRSGARLRRRHRLPARRRGRARQGRRRRSSASPPRRG